VSGKAIVQTNALLVFLSSPAGGSASLRELSERFGIEWKRVLRLLWDASLVEIEGYGLPFNLDLPPNPGEEDAGEEPTTPDSYVSFSDSGELDVPDLALTLDEVIALIRASRTAEEAEAGAQHLGDRVVEPEAGDVAGLPGIIGPCRWCQTPNTRELSVSCSGELPSPGWIRLDRSISSSSSSSSSRCSSNMAWPTSIRPSGSG